MTSNVSDRASLVGALITLVLLAFGAGMVQDPPSPADAAMGKGLLVLGLCSVIVTTSLFVHSGGTAAPRPRRSSNAEGS